MCRLTDAMKQVSAVQQKAVKSVQQSLAAMHEERPSGVLAAMPLAVQTVKIPDGGELADGRGKSVFVVEQGTAYGLDAATGKTLWRRFVALDPKVPVMVRSTPTHSDGQRDEYRQFPAVTALPTLGPAGGDVVLCDPVHQELLRVQGATGATRLATGRRIGRSLPSRCRRASGCCC